MDDEQETVTWVQMQEALAQQLRGMQAQFGEELRPEVDTVRQEQAQNVRGQTCLNDGRRRIKQPRTRRRLLNRLLPTLRPRLLRRLWAGTLPAWMSKPSGIQAPSRGRRRCGKIGAS